jgi:hypothetical protein
VLLLAVSSGEMPWVALTLALSFGFYGLVRKTVPVSPLIGFSIESLLLTPLALGYIGLTLLRGSTVAFQGDWSLDFLLALTGLSTAAPLSRTKPVRGSWEGADAAVRCHELSIGKAKIWPPLHECCHWCEWRVSKHVKSN